MLWEQSGLWSNRLSSDRSVPVRFQAMACTAQLAEARERLKLPLLVSKRVSAHWGQLGFPPAVDVGLLLWLRQTSPPQAVHRMHANKYVILKF